MAAAVSFRQFADFDLLLNSVLGLKLIFCFRGPLYITKEILRTEGIKGMYRGLTSTFMREMPGYFFFFGGYEAGRTFFTPEGKNSDEIGTLQSCCYVAKHVQVIINMK